MTETVVVVDDEADIADLYAGWLRGSHEVQTAYGGEEALETVDDETDVVFLDRRMPDYTGDEVLDRIRERDLGCRVVMVTAVDPDFDIIAMGFDDYLTKPVTREELLETLEAMSDRDEYDETVQDFFSLAAKKATLEAEKTPTELQESDEYQRLDSRVEKLRSEADTALSDVGDDVETLFGEFADRR